MLSGEGFESDMCLCRQLAKKGGKSGLIKKSAHKLMKKRLFLCNLRKSLIVKVCSNN